jgi:hypothetical protein
MATLALPIRELEQSVRIAHAETECVTYCSKKETVDLRLVGQILNKTFHLRFKFADLSRREERLINGLIDRDFSQCSNADLNNLAMSLEDVRELGSITRFWWGESLVKLADQADHLASIADSLRMSADPDCEALLALAVEQIA